MPTAVRSHAKINLGLGIGAPRADGFHGLCTVYQTLEVYDVVTVTAIKLPFQDPSKQTIRLTTNDNRVPTDRRNTAWKIVELTLQDGGVSADVAIHIEKRLPVQGGLGAGSANAVAALIGLEAELGIPTTPPPVGSKRWKSLKEIGLLTYCSTKRLDIAAEVGSDVPLFLIGGAVLGLDRGQEVYPLPDLEPVWCVVATPELGVSTPQAFRDWDALCAAEGLTAEASTDKLNKLSRAYASAFAGAVLEGRQGVGSSGVLSRELDEENLAGPMESALVRTGITSWIVNDFERVVFPQHPSLAEIKRLLLGFGTPEAACIAMLSGSGSSLFGLYLTRGDAEAAQARLSEQVQGVKVQCTLTRTLPRQAYWQEMLLH